MLCEKTSQYYVVTKTSYFLLQSSLCLETNAKSIAGAASVLMSRTALLQPAHLDHVEGRLALLAQKMNDVAERKAALLDDAEKQSRSVRSWDISASFTVCPFCSGTWVGSRRI